MRLLPDMDQGAGTMTRHRRTEFTTQTKREAYARSGGLCECHRVPQLPTFGVGCGVKLGEGNTFYEHIHQDYFTSDNSLDNCGVLSRTCWKAKTAASDLPAIAKSKRLRDRGRGIRKPAFKPLPFGRSSPIKISLSGPYGHEPVWRDSGKPVREGR